MQLLYRCFIRFHGSKHMLYPDVSAIALMYRDTDVYICSHVGTQRNYSHTRALRNSIIKKLRRAILRFWIKKPGF